MGRAPSQSSVLQGLASFFHHGHFCSKVTTYMAQRNGDSPLEVTAVPLRRPSTAAQSTCAMKYQALRSAACPPGRPQAVTCA